jgi:hypothetical protein
MTASSAQNASIKSGIFMRIAHRLENRPGHQFATAANVATKTALESNTVDNDEFVLQVKGYRFQCFYQRGHYQDDLWQKADDGLLHAAVCKCGCGVVADSIDDAIEKLKQSYGSVRENGHWHWQDTPRFNVIMGTDGKWIMGTITQPDLL